MTSSLTKQINEQYCHALKIQGFNPTTVKFLLGHTASITDFFGQKIAEKFEKKGIEYSIAKVQAPSVCVMGWLMGIDAEHTCAERYSSALNSHPQLLQHDVMVECKLIKIEPNEKITDWNNHPRAYYIVGPTKDIVEIKRACTSIFNYKVKTNIPERREARFVACSGYSEKTRPTTKHCAKLATARSRHNQYIKRQVMLVVDGVAELDDPYDFENHSVTLRQFILTIRNPFTCASRLFSGVSLVEGEVRVTTDRDCRHQADTIIRNLPLVVKYKMDRYAQQHFFLPDHLLKFSGMTWTNEGVITAGLEESDTDEDEDFDRPLPGEIPLEDDYEMLEDVDEPNVEINIGKIFHFDVAPDTSNALNDPETASAGTVHEQSSINTVITTGGGTFNPASDVTEQFKRLASEQGSDSDRDSVKKKTVGVTMLQHPTFLVCRELGLAKGQASLEEKLAKDNRTIPDLSV